MKFTASNPLYRICTERLNVPGIESILQTAGLDYTLLEARGSYQGTREDSLIIECITADENAVSIAARAICILNAQSTVLVQRLETAHAFIPYALDVPAAQLAYAHA